MFVGGVTGSVWVLGPKGDVLVQDPGGVTVRSGTSESTVQAEVPGSVVREDCSQVRDF